MAIDPMTIASIAMSVGQTGLGIFTGNQARRDAVSQRNKDTKKVTQYQKEVHEYQNEEAQNYADWQQDELDIKIENFNADRKYQTQVANQRRDTALGIRQFNFDQQYRAYEKSLDINTQQRSANELAEQQAIKQQDNYKYEALVGMEFDKSQTLLNYASAAAGIGLKKAQAKTSADIQLQGLSAKSALGLEMAKAKTAFGKQQINVEALKAGAQAAARGQAGVSAGKVQQGVSAELGARKAQMSKELLFQQRDIMQNMLQNQREIVAQLLFTNSSADLELTKLDDQLELDQAKMSASRDSLMASDSLVRERIALQKKQADLNADARLMLEPEIGPEIPEVIELPEYKFGSIYRPGESPQPKQKTGYIPMNPYSAASSIMSGIGNFMQSDAGQDIFSNMFGSTIGGGGTDFANLAATSYDFSALNNFTGFPGINNNLGFNTTIPNVDLASFPSFAGNGIGNNIQFGSIPSVLN